MITLPQDFKAFLKSFNIHNVEYFVYHADNADETDFHR